jgi:hypothetical protein
MIDPPLGASLDRDLTTAPGRRADKEIENFISRRDQQRRKEEDERQELEGLNTEARSTHEQLTSQYRKDLVQDLQEAP